MILRIKSSFVHNVVIAIADVKTIPEFSENIFTEFRNGSLEGIQRPARGYDGGAKENCCFQMFGEVEG